MKRFRAAATANGLILMSISTLTQPIDSNAMLGRSPDDIIELFGVPDDAAFSNTILNFYYKDQNKNQAKFAFNDGVAIMVPDDGFAPMKLTRPPEDKIYNGQSVRAAALRLGNIASLIVGSHRADAIYADGTKATIALGRVFPR